MLLLLRKKSTTRIDFCKWHIAVMTSHTVANFPSKRRHVGITAAGFWYLIMSCATVTELCFMFATKCEIRISFQCYYNLICAFFWRCSILFKWTFVISLPSFSSKQWVLIAFKKQHNNITQWWQTLWLSNIKLNYFDFTEYDLIILLLFLKCFSWRNLLPY